MYFVHPQIHPVKCCFTAILSLAKLFNGVKLSRQLSKYFPGKQWVFTDMGRSAFKVIVEKLNLQNSEILMPAYICEIFYPILKNYNIKPIFLDINPNTFHIKTEEIEKKITPQTKSILICHTYGLPFNVETIRTSNNSNISNLIIIEDCAHSFGANTGNRGGAAFFSLYKQFPTLRGGMVVCPKDWEIILPKTSFGFRDFISFLNCFPFFALFFKRFGRNIAPRMVRHEKMQGPAGINKVSLFLFSRSLDSFEKSLENRKKLALIFQGELKKLGFEVQEARGNVFCYLSALVPEGFKEKRDDIVQKLRKYGVFCNRIWHTPVILNKDAQKEYQIDLKEFPNTLEAAKRIIIFPLQNHYQEKDIQKMVAAIKKVIS